jgi:hypothetical protein
MRGSTEGAFAWGDRRSRLSAANDCPILKEICVSVSFVCRWTVWRVVQIGTHAASEWEYVVMALHLRR